MDGLCKVGSIFLLIALQTNFVALEPLRPLTGKVYKAQPVAQGGSPQAPSPAEDVEISIQKIPAVVRPKQPQNAAPKPACNWCLRPNCNPGPCKAAPNFKAKVDAENLKNAMKGVGTNEKDLFDILINRSEEQIEQIKQEYLSKGDHSLEHDVEADTSFKVEDMLLALLKTRAEFFADELYHAFKNLKHEAMIMILAPLPPCAIREINSTFYKRYGMTLLHAAKKGSVLKFQEFLEQLIRARRDSEGILNDDIARADAMALRAAGSDAWIKKKRVFIEIFTQRSFGHIKLVKQFYNDMYKPDFDEALARHTGGGKLPQGLLAILHNAEDQPRYFADELEGALQHLVHMGIRDNAAVIRIMRGRCGIDLADIRDNYPKHHGNKKLVDIIQRSSVFDYETVLVSLLTDQNTR